MCNVYYDNTSHMLMTLSKPILKKQLTMYSFNKIYLIFSWYLVSFLAPPLVCVVMVSPLLVK